MIDFTVYSTETGEVIRFGSCQEDDLDMQAGDGQSVISGAYSDDLYYWDGVKMAEKPEKPSEKHSWSAVQKQWVLDFDYLFGQVRATRNKLLSECDWTQVPDAPVDQAAWAAYRQALRDLPASTTDPANVVWPTKPE